MSITRVISLNNGIQTEVVPNTTSAGTGDAGKLVALNSSGLVDATMLPSSGGSSGPSMIVPRDLNWHLGISVPESQTFTTLGMYLGNSTGGWGSNSTPDSAGYVSTTVTTGTTANSAVGVVSNKDILAINPSFRVIYGLPATTSVQCYLGLASYCNPSIAAGDLAASGVAFVGFRYFSSSDGGHWFAYISNYSSSTVLDTGVAVNTSRLQVLDVIWISGLPQFYIDGVRVASAISTANLIGSDPIGLVAVHMNTTATEVVSNIFQLYFGAN